MRTRHRRGSLLCAIGGVARADLATGRDKLDRGRLQDRDRRARQGHRQGPHRRADPARASADRDRRLRRRRGHDRADHAGKDAQADRRRTSCSTTLRRTTGRNADARKDLEQLFKDHPDDRAVRTALGDAAPRSGRHGSARRRCSTRRSTSSTRKKLDLDDADAALPARRGRALHRAVRARERLVSRGAEAPAAADRAPASRGPICSRRSTPSRARRADDRGGLQDQPERARRARRDGRRHHRHQLRPRRGPPSPRRRARASTRRTRARSRSARRSRSIRTSGTSRTRRSIRCSRSTRRTSRRSR